MEDIIDLTNKNPGTPARQTPLSNNIKQFLTPTTTTAAARATPSSARMNTSTPTASAKPATPSSSTSADTNKSSSVEKEKKNCKIKRTELDEDIEIVEEDSDEEQENVVLATPAIKQPSASGGSTANDAIELSDGDDDDIIPVDNGTTPHTDAPRKNKMQKIKHIVLDDDIDIIEEDESGNEEVIQEPRNTAETPSELQLIHETAAVKENYRITTPVASELSDTPIPERSESVKSNENTENHVAASSCPAANSSPRVPRCRTPAPNSRDIERRKLQPDQYKFGVTKLNTENGRIIVPVENDLTLVYEYTNGRGNRWYCRLCSSISRDTRRITAILNADKTFDALVKHVCKPITAEASEKDQERIIAKYSCSNSRKRASSVVPAADDSYEAEEANITQATPRVSRSRTVNYRECGDNFGDNSNLLRSAIKREAPGSSRRSDNSAPPTLREVPRSEWQFGFNNAGQKDKRIIVFESNDRNKAMEYGIYDGFTRCLGCYRIEKVCNGAKLDSKNELLFAPINHFCTPRLYSEIEVEQKLFAARGSKPSGSTESFESSISKRLRIDNDDSLRSLQEVPRSEWYFGYNKAGKKDKRIIVFESSDQQYAKEYTVCGTYLRCLGCQRINQTSTSAKLENNKLFVSTNHICAPKSYTEIEAEQKLLAVKCEKENEVEKSELTESFECSSIKRARIENNESMRHESATPVNVPNDERHESPVNAANNSADVKTDWHDFLVPPSPPSRVNSVQQQIIPAAALPFTTPSPPLSEQSVSPLPDSSIARFYHPSGLFLSQCCESLDLTYSPEAYSFWANIEVYDFDLNSIHQNVHQTADREMSGFSALSLLLTGSESSAMTIKCNLNTYILQNCDVIGDMVRHDLSKSTNPKLLETFAAKNPTEMHFVAMTRLFNCRFAIFKDGSCKRYGNWNPSPEYIPIFLLQFHDGKYSPIFSF